MGAQPTAIERVAGPDIFNVSAKGMAWRCGRPAECGVHEADNNVNLVPRAGLLDRVDHWFWQRQQQSIEARLAKAHDHFELERMIRDLDREKISSLW